MSATTPDTPQVLLEHHLKALRLPTVLREYDKLARTCAVEKANFQTYLLRLTELELLDRDRRSTERRIRQARFPVIKSLDSFDFLAIPALNKTLVLELARSEFLTRKENVLLLGNSGTGKTHIALALGLSACQRGHRVRFITAAALVAELIEARDEKYLRRFQKQLAAHELLIIDELGYVPLSKTGAGLAASVLGSPRIFTLTQQGGKLTGAVEGSGGWFGGGDAPVPIRDGVVEGDHISFKSGINLFDGKIKGAELELQRTVHIPFSLPTPQKQDPNGPVIGPAPDGSDPSIDFADFSGAGNMSVVLRRSER